MSLILSRQNYLLILLLLTIVPVVPFWRIGRANMLLGRVLAIKKPDGDLVCLDGGANLHIANSAKFCHDKVPSTMEVAGVLGSPTPCTSKGSLRLQPADDLPTVILTGAHVVEEFPFSFIRESLHGEGVHDNQEGRFRCCFGPGWPNLVQGVST